MEKKPPDRPLPPESCVRYQCSEYLQSWATFLKKQSLKEPPPPEFPKTQKEFAMELLDLTIKWAPFETHIERDPLNNKVTSDTPPALADIADMYIEVKKFAGEMDLLVDKDKVGDESKMSEEEKLVLERKKRKEGIWSLEKGAPAIILCVVVRGLIKLIEDYSSVPTNSELITSEMKIWLRGLRDFGSSMRGTHEIWEGESCRSCGRYTLCQDAGIGGGSIWLI